MIRLIALLGLLVLVVPTAMAQQPLPDFTGTWTIDAAKNKSLQTTAPEATPGHARVSTGATPAKPGTGQIQTAGVGPTSGAGDTFTIIPGNVVYAAIGGPDAVRLPLVDLHARHAKARRPVRCTRGFDSHRRVLV